MNLPADVIEILDRLERCGHRADVVGGPVRDHIMGRIPHDFDITTSATPEEVKAVFSDERTVDTGIKHGTVTLVKDGENYEITTYRIDGEYTDSRHPDSVSFTKRIEDDLARRDFTVNAISYSPTHGFTDPFGGREDVERRLIRAVGDPVLRFSEDALRILRGIRFASTLGFTIDADTRAAMRACSHLLPRVSVERIYAEFSRLLSGDSAYTVLSEFCDLIAVFLPELAEMRLPDRTLFDAAPPECRLLALFYLNTESPAASFISATKRLKTDARTTRDGATVLKNLRRLPARDDISLTHLLAAAGETGARTAVRTAILLGISDDSELCALDALIEQGTPYRISDLAVDGDDLIALGYRGRAVGECLSDLLESVMDRRLPNERTALLDCLRALQK